ncbi:MAG TPA: amidophosphoribosyltransferase [Legionella sp.]|nr:amidophosphoribosyltransferase [Legionella sp.]
MLTPLGPACRYCAEPLPDAAFLVCGRCIIKKPAVDAVITAYHFKEPLRTLLHEFKYREGLHLLTFIAGLMKDALPASYHTDCLMPVPMHPKRLRQRGFNQAAVLAKYLGRQLNLPCNVSHIQKQLNTAPQAGLSSSERRRNLQDAFQAKPALYQQVTLVDDLLTTGSTANALARVLKEQGVARVDLWCCARVSCVINHQFQRRTT